MNNLDLDGKTIEQANHMLGQKMPDIILDTPNGAYCLCNLNKIGSVSYDNDLQALIGTNDQSVRISPDILYSKDVLYDEVYRFIQDYNKDKSSPKDACIEYTGGKFVINPEQEGSVLSLSKSMDEICRALDSNSTNISLTGCKERPAVISANLELTEEMTRINAIDDVRIDLDGGAEYIISEEQLRASIVQDDSGYHLDNDKIAELLVPVSSAYNTFGTKRQFTTHAGAVIEVGGGEKDTFGYQLDISKTAQNVIDAAYGEHKADAAWNIKGKVIGQKNDIGDTYVEVSIPEQHLWYYVDGKVAFECDVVTGALRNGGTTPGVYQVLYKESPSVLKGDDYETPVSYWMPVTYTGTGLHDASWRGQFGGTIYQYSGSHGCVNMPLDKARELYGIIETGTPVIIY